MELKSRSIVYLQRERQYVKQKMNNEKLSRLNKKFILLGSI